MAEKKKQFSNERGIDSKVKDAWKNYQKQQKATQKKTVKKSKKK